jgi:anaerobic ribonucleoside-triphosphate reductase activating protein
VPWTWSAAGGEDVEVAELADLILGGPEIEGVTFLGGEPFEQAGALADLGQTLQNAGLSVMTFTGYLLEDLDRPERPECQHLIRVTDLLIDGPFRQDLIDLSRPWVGSSNQRYHFLSGRYRNVQSRIAEIPNRVEVRIMPTGEVRINGMINSIDLLALTEPMGLLIRQVMSPSQ